jgi:YVTN family beta-propeller protein
MKNYQGKTGDTSGATRSDKSILKRIVLMAAIGLATAYLMATTGAVSGPGPEGSSANGARQVAAHSLRPGAGMRDLAHAETGYQEFPQLFPGALADNVNLKITEIHMRESGGAHSDTSQAAQQEYVIRELLRLSPQATRTAQGGTAGFRSFESPQIHPLCITPDGTRLLAVNSPANTLSVFQLTGAVPVLSMEIPVGLEPVSVAARNNNEAWVANWLSDSVSIVDLSAANVTRTIDVGDEPTDVVFAGTQRETAFICVSGLAQVKTYDPSAPDGAPQVIDIRGKQPRSLARDPAGGRVFVSVFESGNQTTIVPTAQVTSAGGLPKPVPKMSKKLPRAPDTGLIVNWNGSQWADERGNTKWNQFIPYTLTDIDLVVLDATGPTVAISREIRSIGTHIGNSVLDPAGNRLYVANTESFNQIRFEPNLRGHFLSNRVSIVSLGPGGPGVNAVDINPHINFDDAAGSDQERSLSMALPADIARSSDGTIYLAATGSGKVGVLNAAGAVQARIAVGHGPTGLAIDEPRQQLYCLNRFDETISVVGLGTRAEIGRINLGVNPEPDQIRRGRLILYDAGLSAHGDVACASCHRNAHRDGLAWDLGDPKGSLVQVNSLLTSTFHPMKGPMTTQSLRGIIGTEPLHWRGDRVKLADFNPAFMSLLGGSRELTDEEMADFQAFIQTLSYPPNPLENPDRTYPDPAIGPSPARGQKLFTTARLDANVLTCDNCHTSIGFGTGTNGIIVPATLLQEPQDFKVPQLRGMYQKTGMDRTAGENVAGFGFIHDGSIDSLLDFLREPVFTFAGDNDRLDVAAFVMAFDTGLAPSVGLQVTVSDANKTSSAVSDRINLLMSQADAGNCGLVVKGTYAGAPRSFVYAGNGMFQSDRPGDSPVSWQTLVQAAGAGSELTFTGVVPVH